MNGRNVQATGRVFVPFSMLLLTGKTVTLSLIGRTRWQTSFAALQQFSWARRRGCYAHDSLSRGIIRPIHLIPTADVETRNAQQQPDAMAPIAKQLDDQQIDAIATYYQQVRGDQQAPDTTDASATKR
jgi:hypothetical protein